MATNINALLRYRELDKCFSNPNRKFFVEDLIARCSEEGLGVSRRQIFEDINSMEMIYEAPIERYKDGKKAFYRYSDLDFSILKQPFSNTEKEALRVAIQTLSRMRNMQIDHNVETVLTKLDMSIGDGSKRIIEFEENEFLKGIEFLNPLYHHILEKQVILVEYKGFSNSQAKSYTISPYYLKQYNNRWFLFGWNHNIEKIQNIALDRICEIDIVDDGNYIDKSLDFEEYFEDIIGVSNDLAQEPVKIKMEVQDDLLPYILSKPIHGSQKNKANIITIEVKINYELEALLLSYGEKIKIIEPISLQEKIKERAKALINNYL